MVILPMLLIPVLLETMNVPVLAGEQFSVGPDVISVTTLLSLPDKYEGKPVVVRGNVVANKRSTFLNGRRYHTILVGDARETVTVFSWTRPNVKVGDSVRVEGMFHVWRYNFHHMIESGRIVPLDKDPADFDPAK